MQDKEPNDFATEWREWNVFAKTVYVVLMVGFLIALAFLTRWGYHAILRLLG